jgi:tetratricopeptide (TPR) repeat protein
MSTPSPRLAQLQKLHAADPRDPFLTYGIALEVAKTGAIDDAIAWLDKTLALDAKYCYAYFQKGKMLDEKGETDAARAVLKTGIAIAQTADAHAASEMATLLEGM